MDDEAFESLNEWPVVDACAIIVSVRIAADIVDDDVDRFEARAAMTAMFSGDGCGGEEGAADAACVGEGFESGCYGTEGAADVASGVKLAPFFQ